VASVVSGSVAASQLTGGHFASPLVFLAIEIVTLVIALLSGVMYSVSGRRGWQIALWIAAIILLMQFALATFSFFTITPGLPPAAVLTLLAALFSLGVRQTTGDGDVERQPLIRSSGHPLWQRLKRGCESSLV
jgi:4-amino-4-deoxy-L-arabinose transferase-like glycosyltransferase